ncbi:MAG TPA: radical SAM family heme chaperone HemW [Wenzhouxiangella sp.]|nr:radical SAM family heme chaperone HemW [Wenzhouxiangella sp.]
MLQLPPLSLYIHFPWCIAKCPYCDFNSHALNGDLPEDRYIDALLADLELELPRIWGRTVSSIFLGGGTPSLFSATAMDRLLSGVRARINLAPDAEVTMEANPGAVEHDRFDQYRAAGVNRISLGVQSFNDRHLKILGRVHGGDEARAAISAIRKAGFENFNLDLMWALPDQSLNEALEDIEQALAFKPTHLSHYHLTIEPNTVFAARPPTLPDADKAWDMQEACAQRLESADFRQYEISAWAQPGCMSRHNLNYWRFGDYLGVGAGAHGKITLPANDTILRTRRKSHPRPYLNATANASFIAEETSVGPADRVFEFFLNRLRLDEPFTEQDFTSLTGLDAERIEQPLTLAMDLGLIESDQNRLWVSQQGRRCLNDLQALFLPS